jgi:membrane-associated phospholipid phosphatase
MGSEETAKLISLVFSAPVVASLAFVVLILSEKASNFLALVVITLAFGTLVPLVFLLFLSRRGIIPDIYASQKDSRAIPFAGAISSYLLGSILLVLARAPSMVTALMLCYFGNSSIMMLISQKWKISIHASGITGPATALIYSLGVIAAPLLLIVVPVGWARIKLNAHTLGQVSAGALLTIASTWLQLKIYLMLL